MVSVLQQGGTDVVQVQFDVDCARGVDNDGCCLCCTYHCDISSPECLVYQMSLLGLVVHTDPHVQCDPNGGAQRVGG